MTNTLPTSPESAPARTDTIVLIHGLWMSPHSWEGWANRYRDRGFTVIAPPWAGMDGTVDELRRNPAPIAHESVEAILDNYESIIRALPRPPIIMGHSFGGGFVQVLIDRGLGVAGVGVDAATVRGVFDLPLSTLKCTSNLLINPIARHAAVPLSPEGFRYAFNNNMTLEQSRPIYDRYCVPGSRNVLFTGALANLNPGTAMKVDFKNGKRAPLLFIAGGIDHVVPASANRHNAQKYAHSPAITAYREFPGRTHYTVGQDGWEEVADFALDWALNPVAIAPPK